MFVLILVFWMGLTFINRVSVSDDKLLDDAIVKTLACSTYRYNVNVRQNGKDTITMVEGERAGPNKVHIKGTMQNSQMEFFYIDDVTYMKDPWSERWFTMKGNSLIQSELFMSEFNPMGLLQFREVTQINNLGSEEIDGVKTVVLEIMPHVSNPLLELKYNEFKFKIWIDPKESLIRKAEMLASATGGTENLTEDLMVTINFKDFDEKISIIPPMGAEG